jgi:hypothetical protein
VYVQSQTDTLRHKERCVDVHVRTCTYKCIGACVVAYMHVFLYNYRDGCCAPSCVCACVSVCDFILVWVSAGEPTYACVCKHASAVNLRNLHTGVDRVRSVRRHSARRRRLTRTSVHGIPPAWSTCARYAPFLPAARYAALICAWSVFDTARQCAR